MKLIVGLGNPGEKYEHTRHNLGFVVIDQFLKDYSSVTHTKWEDTDKFKSNIAEISSSSNSEKIILAKPKTYMNNSGLAVSLLANFYKIVPEDIWIVYDELDLPLGSMKIRLGGAAAGHRGVESIMGSIGTDKFWRFRLGIGESKNHQEMAKHRITDVDEFVIGKFTRSEAGKVRELIKRSSKALQSAISDGLEKTMNQFNTK